MTRDDIRVGQIFLVNLTRDDGMIIPEPYKKYIPKYVLVVGFEEGVKYQSYYCIISSDIYHPTETYPIFKRDYPRFYKQRSNLDLSEIRTITVDRLLEGTYWAELTQQDCDNVMYHLANSDYFSEHDKRKYGFIS